jgi:hypothetical protein
MAAAALVTVCSGDSLAAWIRPVWHWRVPVQWWLYALGLPALLYAVVTSILQLIGSPVDWSLAVDRLPAYLSTFVFVLFLGGGMEEPGWRGFGLPVLQETYSPLRATLILGLVWGVWHVPLYGPAGFIVPWVLAFFYTVLWNAPTASGCASCCTPASRPPKTTSSSCRNTTPTRPRLTHQTGSSLAHTSPPPLSSRLSPKVGSGPAAGRLNAMGWASPT